MDTHIKRIGFLETFDLVASLRERLADFDKITLRQDMPGSPHRDTRSIFLRGPSFMEGYTSEEAASVWFEDVPHMDYYTLASWPEADVLIRQIKGRLGKAMVVELKPGGSLLWHIDEGAYAERYARLHVPLVTNPGAIMYSGGEAEHLPVGTVSFFDTRVLHSAVNLGATPRIHLIVDVRREG